MTPSKKITPKEKGMPDIEISNTYSFDEEYLLSIDY